MGLSIIVYGRLPSGGRHSRAGGNPETQRSRTLSEKTEIPPPSFPRRRESSNTTRQDFIGKNRNPTDRHSRKSGNLETQRGRTLSEKTETPPPSFPQKRESSNTTQQEFIGKNRNPHLPSFPQKRESSNTTRQDFIGKNRNPHHRHSRAGGNPDPSARKLTG